MDAIATRAAVAIVVGLKISASFVEAIFMVDIVQQVIPVKEIHHRGVGIGAPIRRSWFKAGSKNKRGAAIGFVTKRGPGHPKNLRRHEHCFRV